METVELQVYPYAELPEKAKDRVRNRHCEGMDYEWYDSVFETYQTAGALMGIDIDKIYFSGFWSQGDGACFTGRYAFKKGAAKALKAEFGGDLLPSLLTVAKRLQRACFPTQYRITANITHRGNYNHEYCMLVDAPYEFNEWEDDLRDALRMYARMIYRALEAEYEYLTSEESIIEAVDGVLFQEDGSFWGHSADLKSISLEQST